MSQSEQIAPPANIAVIGLGNMGQPMAACLSRAGYQVVGYDASPAAAAKFSAAGGKAASSAADAVSKAAVVITLLPDGKIVRKAIDGIRPHLAPGTVVIDMSSSAPVGTKRLGEELIAAGIRIHRRSGFRRRQARDRRNVGDHGRWRRRDPRKGSPCAWRNGKVDFPRRTAGLRARRQGPQQLRLGSWSRSSRRGRGD